MVTSPNQASTAAAPTGSACLPCDIPVFCRNHYYRGKLLTERDFADEQQYQRDRMRLHTLALHGWGVVCGLAVKPHPFCPDRRLVVDEGCAIDCCGREIRVLKGAYVDLPLPPAPLPPPPKPTPAPSPASNPPTSQAPTPENTHPPGEPAPEPCEPAPVPKDLYLCIVYTECQTEFSPAPFDDCGCTTGSALQPNRVCEGFRLELYDSKPSFWHEAVEQGCDVDDCRELYGDGCEPCRKPGDCCVPLAVIIDFVPGRKVLEEQIRVKGHRRELASTETLDKVLRCVLDKLPCGELTRIDDTNWQHGQRYLCRDFMSEFIDGPERHRGFRISFTQKVRAHTIDHRSFQAYAVFRLEEETQPLQLEIVPTEIRKDEDETDWCRLAINPSYARHRLDGREFDLYVVLKCDVITDLRGMAVDGNFIARRFPTGDGVQGGTFESWLHVRPRPPRAETV
ncbi:MAG: hypothetical protein WA231_14525 [Methylocella sp.]